VKGSRRNDTKIKGIEEDEFSSEGKEEEMIPNLRE
jgi:hypothetical protein